MRHRNRPKSGYVLLTVCEAGIGRDGGGGGGGVSRRKREKRKWVLLDGRCLTYFHSHSKTRVKGTVTLDPANTALQVCSVSH